MGEATSTTTPLGHRISTDERGERVVVVPIREYEEMLERVEDAEDTVIIDERQNDPTMPWERMKKQLKANGCL